ncbi:sumo modified ubiquitin conjugating enzyme E2-25k, partial [Pavlovales sp. CCMP2436]
INLKVATQDGNEIHFNCRTTTPLAKLMNEFCQQQGVEMHHSIHFLFSGERIKQDQTPNDFKMMDGDSIVV